MVLATGGGTYVQTGNAELLRTEGAFVVFLQASPEVLLRRCYGSDGPDGAVRPLARDRALFVRLYEQRLPLYRGADSTVTSDHKSPEAVAREIVQKLKVAR